MALADDLPAEAPTNREEGQGRYRLDLGSLFSKDFVQYLHNPSVAVSAPSEQVEAIPSRR